MENYIPLDVSIFQIQLFIAVADERNFSRAAALMNIEQPTLSKRITALEQLLGVRLFDRNMRPIALTPEGELLYTQWKSLMEKFCDSISVLRQYQHQNSNKLSVCTIDSLNAINVMPLISLEMHSQNPSLSLIFEYLPFSKWRAKLLANEVDIALTILFESSSLDENYRWERINVCPKNVCMLKSNPLCGKEDLTFEDLKSQSFVMISPAESPEYHDFIFGLCREHGFTPKVARYASNAHGLLSSLQGNNEVVVCDMFLRDFSNPFIFSRVLPNVDSGMIAVWKRGNTNPFIKPFIDMLKSKYSEAQG